MLINFIQKKIQRSRVPQRVYLDYAGATPLSQVSRDAMAQVHARWGNPGAPHSEGMQAKAVLDEARAKIAKVLAVKPQEIICTSGATEANNLALFGVVRALAQTGIRPHVVSTRIEHSSILEVLDSDEFLSFADVTYIAPNAHGEITVNALVSALRSETRLVSIGWANGEIGTIQPLRALGNAIREYEKVHDTQIVFHSDAGQSAFATAPQPHGVHLDMLTLSSGKLYGPRGIAVLYVRNDVPLLTRMYGGGQERGFRPGTEDPMLLTGYAAALTQLEEEREGAFTRTREMRKKFVQELLTAFPDAVINGTGKHQSAHIVNISIPGIDSEYIMLALDHRGVACSTKSICLLESGDPESPVVKALGGDTWRSTTTLRFSYGKGISSDDLSRVVSLLSELVAVYRKNAL
ncbi:MAG: cysteine desulfurase family protein [Minisyncoccia bacterium]